MADRDEPREQPKYRELWEYFVRPSYLDNAFMHAIHLSLQPWSDIFYSNYNSRIFQETKNNFFLSNR